MKLHERSIVHLDLDAFFVSVECLKNSAFKGKPLIVGGRERGVVAACSYEARAFGVHSAMPMRTALHLCPHATVIKGDHEDYSNYSRQVTEVVAESVPLFEKASIDEFYTDLTGLDKFYNTHKFSKELKAKIYKETGLPVTYALASNKLVSKIATNEVKPDGQTAIPFGEEKSYLAPLAIEKMPMIGNKTATLLREMGIKTIRALSEIPPDLLSARLGRNGLELSKRANGIDDTPVVPYSEQKSISTQETFNNDTIDLTFLNREVARMTGKIGFELRQQNKLTGCVTVKLRYANFDTVTKQLSIPYTSSDHILLRTAKELFDKLYNRRIQARLVGIRFSDLVPGNYQISLFDDTQEMIQLYRAIDNIKKRFGAGALVRAGML
ncbi:DNA polymerase IV [Chitinophaga sp.]|uniref:DNA polymerase IV n=1 Tax=Chitinophaga sp. TaxID=1869181 RepID=UPI0031D1EB36